MAGRDSIRAQQDARDRPREACRVNAQLLEDGTLTLSVTSVGEFRDGGRVSASFDGNEIPDDLRDGVANAMQAALDDAHEDLKSALSREINKVLDQDRAGYVVPADFDPDNEDIDMAMERAAERARGRAGEAEGDDDE